MFLTFFLVITFELAPPMGAAFAGGADPCIDFPSRACFLLSFVVVKGRFSS